MFQPAKLFFRELKDAVSVQSVLLGQDISLSLKLSGAFFERLPSISRRLTRKFLAPQKHLTQEGHGKAVVQLWSEHSFRDPNASRDSRNSARKQLFKEPVCRRIMVYLESSILIVRIAKNARIERRSPASNSTTLRIIPTDKTRDPSFVASLLSPSRHELAIGLPLSTEHLDQDEEEGKFECRLLELNFETASYAKEFYASYKRLKDRWKAEDEDIKRCKRELGEVFGYSLE